MNGYGGSFAEDVDRPGDIDGFFVCQVMEFATGALQDRLDKIDPSKCWDLDKRRTAPYGKPPMWHRYHVELFAAPYGQISGIPGPRREIQDWPTALGRSKNRWKPRGIIKIEGGP